MKLTKRIDSLYHQEVKGIVHISDHFNSLCNDCHFKQVSRLNNHNGIMRYSGENASLLVHTKHQFLEKLSRLSSQAGVASLQFEGDMKEWFGGGFSLDEQDYINGVLNDKIATDDTIIAEDLINDLFEEKMVENLQNFNQNWSSEMPQTEMDIGACSTSIPFKTHLSHNDIKNLSKLINKKILTQIQYHSGYRFITSNASKSKSQPTYYKKFVCHGDSIRNTRTSISECSGSLVRVTYYENSHCLRIVYKHTHHKKYF